MSPGLVLAQAGKMDLAKASGKADTSSLEWNHPDPSRY